MRRLFRGLFVISIFGVLAAHASNGLLRDYFGESAPSFVGMIDDGLRALLIDPFGRSNAAMILLVIGGLLAFWSMVAGSNSRGGQTHHSTW